MLAKKWLIGLSRLVEHLKRYDVSSYETVTGKNIFQEFGQILTWAWQWSRKFLERDPMLI